MKITVITVCYNSAGSIGETLDSVAAQTHEAVEHVIIDGGSTDDTLALVRSRGSRVTTLVSEPDRGIYDAMNKGLALASGDIVGFLNADDVLAGPQALERIAAAARSGADAVYGDLEYVRQDRPTSVLRRWRSGPFTPSRLRFGWMPPHPTFYVRRDALPDPARFDTRLRIAADYDFMLRCLQRPTLRVAYVPEVLVRMRAGGASNRSLAALLRKSREDYAVLRRNRIGGVGTLLCKNARKLPQFLSALRRRAD